MRTVPTCQLIHISRMLTDMAILMIVGSVPDYIQGFVKLYWLLSGRANTPARKTVLRHLPT